MSWSNGPFDQNIPLWFGLQVFWWKRLLSGLQILFGAIVLTGLMTQQHKVRLHEWLTDLAQRAESVRIPSVWRVRDVLKVVVPIVAILALIIAWLGSLRTHSGAPFPLTGVFFLMFFVLMLAMIPIVALMIEMSLLFTLYRASRRYVPPMLAWLFHHERIDRTITVLNFVLLLLVSVIQIYLS